MFNLPAYIAAVAAMNDGIDDDIDHQIHEANRLRNRRVRNEFHPFETMTNVAFYSEFRLPKDLARWLCDRIGPLLPDEGRTSDIPRDLQILSTLRFYGTGSFQRDIGNSKYFCLSQPTMSRVIKNVTEAIIQSLGNECVTFPRTHERCEEISRGFQHTARFPGIIGLVDCTHVAVLAPIDNAWLFRNYRFYNSVTFQVTCDHRNKITSLEAYPGRTQDARIWRQSPFKQIVRDVNEEAGRNYFLLGDAGYPLSPYVITPIPDVQEGTAEYRFTRRHTGTRCAIEQIFGRLKGKFRCLQKSRALHYDVDSVIAFFKACAILHNLLVDYGYEYDEDELFNDFDETADAAPRFHIPNDPDEDEELNQGRQLRQRIIDTYFNE